MKKSRCQPKGICAQFDYYIKLCLRNEARNLKRAEERREEHEVLFSELPEHYEEHLYATADQVAALHTFQALHYSVTVENDRLSEALRLLPNQKRTIILLHYFLNMSDSEISVLTHTRQEQVKKTRQRTLSDLRKNMEDTYDET